MQQLRRSGFTLASAALLVLAFAVWTAWLPQAVDEWWRVAPPEPTSNLGQVLAIVAGVTAWPVLLVVTAGVAWWMSRRRFYTASGAVLLAFVLTLSLTTLMRHSIGRARPESPFAGAITQPGFAYPSMHVAMWTAGAVMVATLLSTMRRRVWPGVVAGAAAVLVVAVNRLWMGAHQVTDVVGGALLGGFAASLANLLADVHVVRRSMRGDDLAAAVIYNPVKVVGIETFRGLVQQTLEEYGYERVVWLPTEADDPGVAMARRALDEDVDVVLVAGGDGTVRVVLGEFADTGQKVAILPSGTGNLLAKNLGIPLDVEQALRLGLEKAPTAIDLIEVQLPDGVQFAAVLAGVGIDADIMNDTDEDLKKAVGVVAYVMAGARHLDANPMRVRLTVDDQPPVEVDASLVSIGNVGELEKGVSLMPEASARDGVLDVLVATPSTRLDMAQMISDVLFEAGDGPNIARYTGSQLRLEVPEGAACQIDGDVVGDITDVTFQVRPEAVQLALP